MKRKKEKRFGRVSACCAICFREKRETMRTWGMENSRKSVKLINDHDQRKHADDVKL